ncbi:MAG: bifunctional phosphopantothenoylcysteine decarboxylase/phosphopantothenate--cysteine ligase CoaBC [Ignavibacteria bacterium]|nr:MAG: bifunctional phosphopantothenoylcysteine decarboxylase/phosphopantothenate--cysteine ligase CoaBC [Ignavibacteria bacterium]
MSLAGKHIIVGVTGSIAAYKSALLVRELVKAGAEVRVIMTASACEFITPLTLATLSGSDVVLDMFPQDRSKGTWHIHLGVWADLMVIAPASANTIAKLAHGFADNALSSLALAVRCPLVVAPAMDTDMYLHVATQDNIEILRKRGASIVEPESGELASGLTGPGRLPDTPVLMQAIETCAGVSGDLSGRRVLVTAGPTHEAIDPVRYIGNHSSGKMGFAVASAAARRGAEVTLVSGPTVLAAPQGVKRVDVESARQMYDAVMAVEAQMDICVLAAAVADFTLPAPAESKIKKENLGRENMTLELQRTPDILAQLGKQKHGVLVGFALETDNMMENALRKLRGKNADIIVLNNPREEGAGFGTDTNIATIIHADESSEALSLMTKEQLADVILDHAVRKLPAVS